MKLTFRTSSGYPLSTVSLVAVLAALLLVFAIIAFFITDGDSLRQWVVTKTRFTTEQLDWIDESFVLFMRTLSVTVALIGFVKSFRRIIKGIFFSISALSRKFLFPILSKTFAKVKDEIKSFPVNSDENFTAEIKLAKYTSKMLSEASELGRINNKVVWELHWPESQLERKRLAEISEPETSEKTKLEGFPRSIDSLKASLDGLKDDDARIEFVFSPIQPSVLKLIRRISDLVKVVPKVHIAQNSTTGPMAVKVAYEKKISNLKRGSENLVVLIAPLSAFCTFSIDEYSIDQELLLGPSEYFIPICPIISEPQNLLIAEGESVAAVSDRTIFYYNNSTAEEFIAKFTPELLGVYSNIVSIENFSDYKNLLNGGTSSEGYKIKSGDAIVTWPPLTNFYEGRTVSESNELKYFVRNPSLEIRSQIFLFADKNCFGLENEITEAAWSFINCIAKGYLLLHHENTSGSKYSIEDLMETYKVLSERTQFYTEMVK